MGKQGWEKHMSGSNTSPPVSEKPRLDWHSAFFAALKAELVDYLDVLQFENEHPLNEQPLRIDALVIKAPPGVEIKKNFAENFRGHNIFEYKSPEDSLGITEYLKTIGYAYLYQAVEDVDYTDISVTFVCAMKPEALFAHLQIDPKNRFTVTEKQLGIYEVDGERFPVQVLESKLLPPEENAWLKSLKTNADRAALERVIQSYPAVGEKVNLGAFWYVVSRANVEFIMEVFGMDFEQAEKKLDVFFEEIGFTQKVEERTIDKTLIIIKGLQNNIPLAQLSSDTGMPLERVQKIKQEVYG